MAHAPHPRGQGCWRRWSAVRLPRVLGVLAVLCLVVSCSDSPGDAGGASTPDSTTPGSTAPGSATAGAGASSGGVSGSAAESAEAGSDTASESVEPSQTARSSVTAVSSGPTDTPASGGPAGAGSGVTASPPVGASVAEGPAQATVNGQQIAVDCTGSADPATPTVILLAGMPDPLDTFAALQRRLSTGGRVCSYDRPGEGHSEPPAGTQSLADAADMLAGVLDAEHIARPVVVVGHSLGGLVAAQFTHRYPDRVAGALLLDATPPSAVDGIQQLIPDTATGVAAAVRGEMVAIAGGENPEKLVISGDPVGSLGDTPLIVVQHGKQIFSQVPKYGKGIQRVWSKGQRQWAATSTASRSVTATDSGHYIYRDQPDLVIKLVNELRTV